uniref:Uncharacterized protein n=1 Tax=Tetradesmus obliquus TaxID=3088 RepID=A0A383WQE3_TETOB|eukprot:jgi/Sobl393_1/4609/SZX79236.1
MTAKLLATSKAVAAAASSARSSQLQKLQYSMTSSSKAQQVAAWLVKHKDLLQNVSTLQLRLDRTAIESSSRLADLSVWGVLTSALTRMLTFCPSAISATVAASILRSLPRGLSSVNLQLQDDKQDVMATPLYSLECAIISSELAALPNLQSISIAGPGAAACLPFGPSLATTFTQLTSIRLGAIRTHAGVAQLLQGLPASLQQLRLDVDTPDRLDNGNGDYTSDVERRMLQLQRSIQMAHLTALTTLNVTGKHFVIGRNSKLPPNLINLTVPMRYPP